MAAGEDWPTCYPDGQKGALPPLQRPPVASLARARCVMSLGVSKGIGEVANYKPLGRCGMEELAARQRSITPSGGVLFARNTDREEKAAARQLVLDLFHPDRWGPSLRILTMPSVHWRFERKLLAMRQPGWMRDAK